MVIHKQYRKPTSLLLLLLVLAVLGMVGCDKPLSVENPGAITESSLTDPALEQFTVNGVVGEFQYAHSYSSLYTGIFTDELLAHHTYMYNHPIALRTCDESNVYVDNIYTFWQKARASADDGAERIRTMLGSNASTSLNLAKVLAYGGYSYVMLGETFGQVTINISRGYTSEEIWKMAIPKFEESITIATAAIAAGKNATEGNKIINLARIGIARAYLNLNDKTKVIEYASQVPSDFKMWVMHSTNAARQYNPFCDATTGSANRYISPGLEFQNLNDPRVTHTATKQSSLTGTLMYTPYLPSTFSGWDSTKNQTFAYNSNVLFASGLEARYMVAEAQGATSTTLTLVNERRNIGRKPAVNYTGDALLAELRWQRALDLYLTNHRLGDLRRYKRVYSVNLFPTGTDPFYNEAYGTVEDFPIPLSEKNSNPNI